MEKHWNSTTHGKEFWNFAKKFKERSADTSCNVSCIILWFRVTFSIFKMAQFLGRVIGTKMDKTAKVLVTKLKLHPIVMKVL